MNAIARKLSRTASHPKSPIAYDVARAVMTLADGSTVDIGAHSPDDSYPGHYLEACGWLDDIRAGRPVRPIPRRLAVKRAVVSLMESFTEADLEALLAAAQSIDNAGWRAKWQRQSAAERATFVH